MGWACSLLAPGTRGCGLNFQCFINDFCGAPNRSFPLPLMLHARYMAVYLYRDAHPSRLRASEVMTRSGGQQGTYV